VAPKKAAARRRHDGREQRQPGVLAIGQVDRVGERLVGVLRPVDGYEDVVKHDALPRWAANRRLVCVCVP